MNARFHTSCDENMKEAFESDNFSNDNMLSCPGRIDKNLDENFIKLKDFEKLV